jgi:hypothetical protein
MFCTGKNKGKKSGLGNSSESLKIMMFYNIEQNLVRNFDKTVNRVVDDLEFILHLLILMIDTKIRKLKWFYVINNRMGNKYSFVYSLKN